MSEIGKGDPGPWLQKADHDLKTVETILTNASDLTDVACFHGQQAAEKYLKAYLITVGCRFGKTHDVEYLLSLCGEKDPGFSGLREGARRLSRFSVEPRYPDDFVVGYSETDARQALQDAQAIRDFVRSRLSAA